MYGAFRAKTRRYKKRTNKSVSKASRAPTKYNIGTALISLQKQVKTLKLKQRADSEVLMYSYPTTQNISQPYNVVNLCSLPNWTRIFGTEEDDEEVNKAYFSKMNIDYEISLENDTQLANEEATTIFTVFLVSLKKEGANLINYSSGALNTLINTEHFTALTSLGNTGGYAYVNRKFFNIHYCKRFTLSNHEETLQANSAQTQYGTKYRDYIKVKPKCKIENPSGDWKGTPCPRDPTDNYYLLIFNDNSIADVEFPKLRMNTLYSVIVS